MDNFSISDELRRYLALFWHFAWVLVLCTLLAAGVAYLISAQNDACLPGYNEGADQ